MMMRKILTAIAVVFGLAGCTAGNTGAPPINQTNPHDPNFSALQFAVGTANMYGVRTGLNVVSTLRQPNGTSATGVNTPAIKGPFTFNLGAIPSNGSFADLYTTLVLGSPSLPETSASAPLISGTQQSVHPGTPFCDTTTPVAGFITCPAGISPTDTSFGQSGGVFASGLGPYNANGGSGTSYSYQPYPDPLYGNSTTSASVDTHPQFVPWGGPPAFDPPKPASGFPNGTGMGMRDGLAPLFNDGFNFGTGCCNVFLGVGEGITAFEFVTPRAGAYTLSDVIATLGSGGGPNVSTLTAQATMTSLAVLPTLATPVVTPDGTGGASFTATLPAGVTEALVQIVDYGPGGGPNNGGANVANCQGPKGTNFAPMYYTVFINASGTYQLGNLHGANTNLTGGVSNLTPSHSICTLADNQTPPDGLTPANAGDNFTVQMIGFDYPAYEMAHSLLLSTVPQRPALTGGNGQADLTISIPNEEDWQPGGTYNVTPLLARPRLFHFTRAVRSFMPISPELAKELGIPARR